MTKQTRIGKFGQEYLQQSGINCKPILELRDVGTMLAMCYAEMGFMFCNETFINLSFYNFSKQHLIYPLPDHDAVQIAINYPANKQESMVVQAFVKIASESLAKNNQSF